MRPAVAIALASGPDLPLAKPCELDLFRFFYYSFPYRREDSFGFDSDGLELPTDPESSDPAASAADREVSRESVVVEPLIQFEFRDGFPDDFDLESSVLELPLEFLLPSPPIIEEPQRRLAANAGITSLFRRQNGAGSHVKMKRLAASR